MQQQLLSYHHPSPLVIFCSSLFFVHSFVITVLSFY
ncbi:unnamed protein product [Brassica oleracea]|uniref:(rape) hypothetical protein n=1 Tax=Brassica napus TaxID=3708 RepID=A0A816HYW5_BRANA|nr:unnamed protein product [Brassica napus]